jgi:hypothetical protein
MTTRLKSGFYIGGSSHTNWIFLPKQKNSSQIPRRYTARRADFLLSGRMHEKGFSPRLSICEAASSQIPVTLSDRTGGFSPVWEEPLPASPIKLFLLESVFISSSQFF